MKASFCLGLAVAALTASSVMAADLPPAVAIPARAPAIVAVDTSWTGFYIGAEGGGGFATFDQVVTTDPGGFFAVGNRLTSNKPTGGLAGGAIGADYQFTNWLIGVKGSYDWANFTNSANTASTLVPGNTVATLQKITWLAMGVGRVGILASPDLLIYGDGGGAWAGSKRTGNLTVDATGASIATTAGNETLMGWTVGGGVEYRFMQHVSLLFEYNHIDFGTKAVTNTVTTAGVVTTNNRNLSGTMDVGKVGLNLRF